MGVVGVNRAALLRETRAAGGIWLAPEAALLGPLLISWAGCVVSNCVGGRGWWLLSPNLWA